MVERSKPVQKLEEEIRVAQDNVDINRKRIGVTQNCSEYSVVEGRVNKVVCA